MHPWLEDLTVLTMLLIFSSENKCRIFFTDMGLLPKEDKNKTPNCPHCFKPMSIKHVKKANTAKSLTWAWDCSKTSLKKKCFGWVSPTVNTIFYNSCISYQDMIIIIYCFVIKISFSDIISEISRMRHFFNEGIISSETVQSVLSVMCRVCEVHASYFVNCLGGPGKSLYLADTYYCRRTFNSKYLGSKDLFVLGVFCEEDREGIYVEIDENVEIDLLSIIHEYCHPETTIIPIRTNVAKAKRIITGIKSKQLTDSECNKIIDIKLWKDHLNQSLSASKKLNYFQRYMSRNLYFRCRFLNKSIPEQMETLLQDIRAVYPGYGIQGLTLRSIQNSIPVDFPSDSMEV